MKLYDPYADFETVVLPNGLTVYVLHQPDHPWVAVNIVVHTGALIDPKGLTGVAHFLEHLASDNVPGYTAKDIENFFTDVGGGVNLGSTSFLSTRYKFFVPAQLEPMTKACNIFGQLLFDHDLTFEIESERAIILQEYRRKFEFDYQFEWICSITENLRPGLWDEGILSPLGNAKTVPTITHDVLELFYREWYTPANVSLVLVGGFDLKQVEAILLGSALAKYKPGQRNPLPTLLAVVPKPLTNRLEFHLGEYTSTQVDYFDYGYITCLPGRFNFSQITEVVRRMLAGIWFDELREKQGWTYSTRADFDNLGSFVQFGCSADKLNLKAEPEIEPLVVELMSNLAGRRPMFEKIKKARVQGLFLHDVNDRDLCDNAADDLVDYQRIVPMTEVAEAINSLTTADLDDFCQQIKPEKSLVVIKLP
ncbi:MAG: pitrilysin family protein [bacterium]|nr:pitrilysin family protein [bacterium]